jgi:uncharacterized membrane protein (UPF0182 family)
LPFLVEAVYVRPNEISIERPYIERHIEATSIAFGLNRNATGTAVYTFRASNGRSRAGCHAARQRSPVGPARLQRNDHPDSGAAPLLHISRNRRRSLLPNGRIKQVLLSPREIDVSQLSAEASQSWINPRFIYTHGIGVVLSEVNKITPTACPFC